MTSETDARIATLRKRLVDAQLALLEARQRALVIELAGDDRRGVHQLANRLHEWMDARHLELVVHGKPSKDERTRPFLWRAWRDLPPKGEATIVVRGAVHRVVTERVKGQLDSGEFAARCAAIVDMEDQCAREGVAFVKLWLTVPPAEHARQRNSRDALDRWRRKRSDRALEEDLAEGAPIALDVRARTEHALGRWSVLDGQDRMERDLQAAERIATALEASTPPPEAPALPDVLVVDALGAANLALDVDEAAYDRRREALQDELTTQGLAVHDGASKKLGRSVVLVFQGWDAAGKGGAIRRILPALDASFYRVLSIGAPDAQERQFPYMWRFWRELPRRGCMALFDRSWYGRVLVERVEGFAAHRDWERAYAEIRQFEASLAAEGTIVRKFFLHISAQEQLRRFRAREVTEAKQHKLTEDDWRNREQRAAYVEAANEMLARTHTKDAPWLVVPAESKRHARLAILEATRDALAEAARD